jgi:hypothetical protein
MNTGRKLLLATFFALTIAGAAGAATGPAPASAPATPVSGPAAAPAGANTPAAATSASNSTSTSATADENKPAVKANPFLSWLVGVTALVAVVMLAGSALLVLWKIVSGAISLNDLLSSATGASLSRFQFMIFTFVIASSYLMAMISKIMASSDLSNLSLPDATNSAWLLGMSAAGYAAGKAIQASGDAAMEKAKQPQGQS